jgi:hypothetical protein
MHHRALRDAIPLALHHLAGISEKQAGDLIEVQSIGELRGFLEHAGYEYVHTARRWLPA